MSTLLYLFLLTGDLLFAARHGRLTRNRGVVNPIEEIIAYMQRLFGEQLPNFEPSFPGGTKDENGLII
jgi:hypothetical protein